MFKCVLNFGRIYKPSCGKIRSICVSPFWGNQNSVQAQTETHISHFLGSVSHSQFEHAYAIIRCRNKNLLSNYVNFRDIPSLFLETEQQITNKETSKTAATSSQTDVQYQAFNELSTFDSKTHFELVNQLIVKLKQFNNHEILRLLQKVNEFSKTGISSQFVFNPLVSACDNELVKRMKQLSLKESFQVLDLFYVLQFYGSSKFQQQVLRRLASVVSTMTPLELCQYLFFCSLNRSFPSTLDQEKLEGILKDFWQRFNIDDLAVISMAYFVSNWGFKDLDLVQKLSIAICNEAETIQDLPLSNMLKLIRRSTTSNAFIVEKTLHDMLDALKKQIPRLNIKTNVQMMLVMTTGFSRFDPEIIGPVACRVLADKKSTRLKDIERVAYCLSVSGHTFKKLEGFWQEMEVELLREERKKEVTIHSRSLVSTLVYFITAGHFPRKLIEEAMNPELVHNAINKGYRNTGRELMVIDGSVRIECRDYDGPLLTDDQIKEFTPMCHPPLPNIQSKTLTYADRFLLDLLDATSKIFTMEDIQLQYVRPHFSTPDIVVSEKGSNGRNVICVVVPGTRNMYLRKTSTPSGVFNAKKRQLRALDLPIVEVPWFDYVNIQSSWNKVVYLRKNISLRLNRKV